jgi:tryptophan synthase alpha subunit
LQAAATRSLAQGTTLDKVLGMLKEVVPNLKAPVVLFAYYNPILKRGPEAFMKAVKAAGASGLVVPDLPLEETGKLHKFTVVNDLELVCLLSNPFLASTPQLISCFQCAISLPLSLPCPASVKQEDMCNVRREPSTGKSIKTSLIMHV